MKLKEVDPDTEEKEDGKRSFDNLWFGLDKDQKWHGEKEIQINPDWDADLLAFEMRNNRPEDISAASKQTEAEDISEKSEQQAQDTAYTGDRREMQGERLMSVQIFRCTSCGAQIMIHGNERATFCSFCGQPTVIFDRESKEVWPDYIIPFKKDKKQAKEAYRKHLEGKKFLPGVFKQQNHIDEIKGVYVPFWIFDLKAKADFSYHAEKTRVWVSNDIEYTEHENFEVKRAGTVEFEKVPADGSKKMDDTLMESVEPYDFKEAVPFRMAYMAGYLADRYDVPKEECIGRAKKRIRRSTEREFRNTVKGYHVIDQEKANMEIKDQAKYALYPVWILNTTWKGKKYIFAMNGQTGKIVGDLPADNGAFWRFIAMWGAGIGLVLYALLWVFMVLL